MDAIQLEQTKAQIRHHLRTAGESTAKAIAGAIGCGDDQERVNSAINAMRTYGEVECKQHGLGRGKGSSLVYWLTNPAAGETEPETATDKTCCNGIAVIGRTASEMLAEKDAEIARLADEAKALKAQAEEAIRQLAGWMAMAQRIGCDSHMSVASMVAQLQHDLENERCAARMMHEQVQRLESATAAPVAVSVEDVSKGYLVRVKKRKSVIFAKAENAIGAAKAAAKTTGRGEVFALVHVTTAVRKTMQVVELKNAA